MNDAVLLSIRLFALYCTRTCLSIVGIWANNIASRTMMECFCVRECTGSLLLVLASADLDN